MTPSQNGSDGSSALGCDALVFFGASGDLALHTYLTGRD